MSIHEQNDFHEGKPAQTASKDEENVIAANITKAMAFSTVSWTVCRILSRA